VALEVVFFACGSLAVYFICDKPLANAMALPLFEIALVLVRFDHVASRIINRITA
jgi:hypothetical protein